MRTRIFTKAEPDIEKDKVELENTARRVVDFGNLRRPLYIYSGDTR
jgi:hypothetical protein